MRTARASWCVLTGQLGDVMKESARAAWTYAAVARRGAADPADDSFDRDIHIHVPAGAIPKDGPSAGVAMASAVVSAMSGRAVRHDIAMTGEITLRGPGPADRWREGEGARRRSGRDHPDHLAEGE